MNPLFSPRILEKMSGPSSGPAEISKWEKDTHLGKLQELEKQLKEAKENNQKREIRMQILQLRRELNRTKQFTEISENTLVEWKTSLDDIKASDLLKVDKESKLRRGEFLSKSFLYKRTTDSEWNIFEEASDGKDLKEGDTLYVDFWKNVSAENKIWVGDFLPIDIKVVKVTDSMGRTRIWKRSIQWNKVWYYDEAGYIPVYNWYIIEIPKQMEVEEVIQKSNPNILLSSNEEDEERAKDAFIETARKYEQYGEGFSPWNMLEKKEFQDKATELAKEIERKYWIPWQVTYAQATLETWYGKKAPGNNYFWIKWNSGWTYKTKEVVDGKEIEINATFRWYSSMEESFEDYAKLLTTNQRYASAFEFKNSPELFLQEVIKNWYATDPEYVSKAKNIWANYDKIKNFTIDAPEIIWKTHPDAFIWQAQNYIWTRYVWGGNSDVWIDCSHLISRSLIDLWVATESFYRVAADLRNMTPTKPLNQVVRWDLIFWHGSERGISHVAIATWSPINNTLSILDASWPSSWLWKVAERTIELKSNLSAWRPIFYA